MQGPRGEERAISRRGRAFKPGGARECWLGPRVTLQSAPVNRGEIPKPNIPTNQAPCAAEITNQNRKSLEIPEIALDARIGFGRGSNGARRPTSTSAQKL
jgi:hypothetical protein